MAIKAGATQLVDVGSWQALGGFVTATVAADTTLTADAGAVSHQMTVQIVTSGTSSRTVTFGTGFKTTGTLATGTVSGKSFMVSFISDGGTWIETARTAAM